VCTCPATRLALLPSCPPARLRTLYRGCWPSALRRPSACRRTFTTSVGDAIACPTPPVMAPAARRFHSGASLGSTSAPMMSVRTGVYMPKLMPPYTACRSAAAGSPEYIASRPSCLTMLTNVCTRPRRTTAASPASVLPSSFCSCSRVLVKSMGNVAASAVHAAMAARDQRFMPDRKSSNVKPLAAAMVVASAGRQGEARALVRTKIARVRFHTGGRRDAHKLSTPQSHETVVYVFKQQKTSRHAHMRRGRGARGADAVAIKIWR
jgi:hypothetical protein